MISIWGQREQLQPYVLAPDYPARYTATLGQAMETFVAYELGFGGRVSNVVTTDVVTIEVQTRVMGKLDTTWFQGSVTDMRPLLVVAAQHSRVWKDHSQELIDSCLKVMEWQGLVPGRPLFITMAAPHIAGELSTKTALLIAMGFSEWEDVERFRRHSIKDLCAAWELANYSHEGMGDLL